MSDDPTSGCPKCGYASQDTDTCEACGAILAKIRAREALYEAYEAKRKADREANGKATPEAGPETDPEATPEAGPATDPEALAKEPTQRIPTIEPVKPESWLTTLLRSALLQPIAAAVVIVVGISYFTMREKPVTPDSLIKRHREVLGRVRQAYMSDQPRAEVLKAYARQKKNIVSMNREIRTLPPPQSEEEKSKHGALFAANVSLYNSLQSLEAMPAATAPDEAGDPFESIESMIEIAENPAIFHDGRQQTDRTEPGTMTSATTGRQQEPSVEELAALVSRFWSKREKQAEEGGLTAEQKEVLERARRDAGRFAKLRSKDTTPAPLVRTIKKALTRMSVTTTTVGRPASPQPNR